MKHVIRPAARRDILLQFEHFLKEDAPNAATRFLEAVDKAVAQLLEMPGHGCAQSIEECIPFRATLVAG